MNIKDYEFHVGDEVITTDGIKGKITCICTCESCKSRGFYEPFWAVDGSDYEHCIDKFIAEMDFYGFHRIGKYRFNDLDKGEVLREMSYYEDGLKQLRKQLKTIEELEMCDNNASW